MIDFAVGEVATLIGYVVGVVMTLWLIRLNGNPWAKPSSDEDQEAFRQILLRTNHLLDRVDSINREYRDGPRTS